MKKISSDKMVVRLTKNAAFLSIALALSFVESIIPIAALPLPGFKIGIANIAIIAALYHSGSLANAAAVSLCRVIITSVLFGNVTSFAFSMCGGAMVIAALSLLSRTARFSFTGVSVVCAAAHNLGQLAAAMAITGTAVIAYIPVLLAASAFYGALNGIILNLLPDKIKYDKQT